MPIIDSLVIQFVVALGVGLLIGAERERRKGEGPSRGPAGIRTFAIASMMGAVAFHSGGAWLLSVATAGVFALMALAYWRARDDDPGVTSEFALIATVLLGGLATQNPSLAAGLGVAVAILLGLRSPLHYFVRSILTEAEAMDALIFAGATLIVLPLLPNRALGPYGALNPHNIWIVVILVIGISAIGYVATRWLGPRYGLPITGLASGFISSTATIGAMGARVVDSPSVLRPASAGAILSTVATVIQLALVLAATSTGALETMAIPLACAAVAAISYGATFTIHALQEVKSDEHPQGHAFSLAKALLFTLTLCIVLVASAALQAWFGERGILIAAAVAGFVDTHSAAISIASLVSTGRISPSDALLPILAGFSTNTVSKMTLAAVIGGREFAKRVLPGLILTVLAAWAGPVLAGQFQ